MNELGFQALEMNRNIKEGKRKRSKGILEGERGVEWKGAY